jgi:protease-4
MKEFLRSTLATITGVLICGFIFIILGVTMLAGFVASSESETIVMPNSVFTLELKGTVQERYQPSPVDQFFEDQISTYGLEDILNSIQKAKEDEQIKGIYLHTGALTCSTASLQAARLSSLPFSDFGLFLKITGRRIPPVIQSIPIKRTNVCSAISHPPNKRATALPNIPNKLVTICFISFTTFN